MFDYNFPKRLTQERLTLLLLSLAIPTETVILQKIYKKKKELEIEDIHSESKYLKSIPKGHCILLRQIRCFRAGFILYQSDEVVVELNPLKKLPLVDRFRTSQAAEAAAGGGLGPLEVELFAKKLENLYSPRGVDIVNQIFEEYKEHNDITRPHCGYDSNGWWWWKEPIWNSSTDSKYTIEGPQHIDKTLDERQKGFNDMDISGELDDVLYDDSEGNGGAILVQEWTTPSSIYF
tara:strand:+ start:1638 stop:2339 length:702 start_codon:yes stop_codon:yes gene_type:complete